MTDAAEGMPTRLTGMCPLLMVFDMPTALAFYRDLLGFEVIDAAPPGDEADWAWLRNGVAQVMLNTMFEAKDRPASPDTMRRGFHRDTEIYFGCGAVDELHDYLVDRGIEIDELRTAPYGMRQLYVRDPDGYVLCFQHPVA